MLERDYVIFSAEGVSLLVGHSLKTKIDIFVDTAGQWIIVNINMKSFKFWVVALYVSNCTGETFLFSAVRGIPGRLRANSIIGEWNEILDPKLDRVRQSTSRKHFNQLYNQVQ